MSRIGSSIAAGMFLLSVVGNARGETFESFTEPYRKIDLAPAESGVVDEIAVREGDAVRAGQVLASLDKEVLVISREIAQAAAEAVGRRDAALAERRLREMRLRKLQALRRDGHSSSDEVQRAEADLAAAEGQCRAVEEQASLDRMEIRKTEAMIERRLVRSPIEGVVTKIHREQGEYVTPVAPTVVTVTQLNLLRAVFNLPPDVAASLRVGGATTVLLGDGDVSVAGKVEFVSPITDADSGTVRVKIVIDNSDRKLQAGNRCLLRFGDAPPNQTAAQP